MVSFYGLDNFFFFLAMSCGLPRLHLHCLLMQEACNVRDACSIRGSEDPLEKGMATHSSILAWRIPRTMEPGRLQSIGSHRSEAT